jgi:hypothetical protein
VRVDCAGDAGVLAGGVLLDLRQIPTCPYFDHPPLVAWLIWLGTALFGDGQHRHPVGDQAVRRRHDVAVRAACRPFGLDRRAQSLGVLAPLALPILSMTHFLANRTRRWCCSGP